MKTRLSWQRREVQCRAALDSDCNYPKFPGHPAQTASSSNPKRRANSAVPGNRRPCALAQKAPPGARRPNRKNSLACDLPVSGQKNYTTIYFCTRIFINHFSARAEYRPAPEPGLSLHNTAPAHSKEQYNKSRENPCRRKKISPADSVMQYPPGRRIEIIAAVSDPLGPAQCDAPIRH